MNGAPASPVSPTVVLYRRVLTAVLALYWLAMFVGTHLPKIPRPLEIHVSDKWQHYAAYAGLAVLLGARLAVTRRPTIAGGLAMLSVIAVYGALDELTQIPVGRTADIFDWHADMIGALSGLGAFLAMRWLVLRNSGRTPETPGAGQ